MFPRGTHKEFLSHVLRRGKTRGKEAERRNAHNTGNARGRSFQLTVEEAKDATDVVTGIFLVHGVPMRILFDSGANRSFIASRNVHLIPLSKSKLDTPLKVEVGNSNIEFVLDVFRGCEIRINSESFLANLVPFPLGEFDIILGMDWLSSYGARISCDEKVVKLKSPSGET